MPDTVSIRRHTAALVMLGLLAGCALRQEPAAAPPPPPEPPPAALEPSPSDPFAAIDAAFARLALTRPPASFSAAPPASLWPRLTARFRFGECAAGSRAADWADWYADNRDYMQRVLNRARPWLHHIVGEIERRDLPGELALLPVVESAFDPFAYSHGRAAGPWQFLAGTARDFGVEINDWYDGRRDFIAATSAALDYLEYLAGLFDEDWALALAAYNAGQGRVRRAIRRNRARGLGTAWHELRLPRETRGYVPKLKGLGCLFRDPVRHAFVLPSIPDAPQVAAIELGRPVDLVALALSGGLDPTELVTLNAGLNRHRTPPGGRYHLVVPVDRADAVRSALATLPAPPAPPLREVRVRRGDTLSELARRHGTSIRRLRELNGLSGTRLIAGQTLKLPGEISAAPATDDPAYTGAYRELVALQQQLLPTDRFIHRVRSGESLWVIARRYGVSVGALQQMNGLGGSSMIRPGQRLVIEADRRPEPPMVVDGKYVVRQGDSLWTISRRQQVALGDLMRWNGLGPDSVLQPGQELVIRRDSDA